MEKKYRFFIGVIVAVFLLLIILFAAINLSILDEKDGSLEVDIPTFVDCLNSKNVILYGKQNETNLDMQLGLFGNSSKDLKFIDCNLKSEECSGIIIYPTWKINDILVHGSLSLNILSKFSGCSLS